MADLVPAQASYDITSGSNWMMLLKFWGVNILVSVAVVLIIIVVIRVFLGGGMALGAASSDDSIKGVIGGAMGGMLVAIIPMILIVLTGQMYALSWFEEWDGCYKKRK